VKEIGVGACGEVYLYMKPKDGQKMAIKMEKEGLSSAMSSTLGREAHFMRIFNEKLPDRKNGHKRVPKYYGDTFSNNRQCLKIEFIEYSLPDYISIRQ
jgi:hypothetical protein